MREAVAGIKQSAFFEAWLECGPLGSDIQCLAADVEGIDITKCPTRQQMRAKKLSEASESKDLSEGRREDAIAAGNNLAMSVQRAADAKLEMAALRGVVDVANTFSDLLSDGEKADLKTKAMDMVTSMCQNVDERRPKKSRGNDVLTDNV